MPLFARAQNSLPVGSWQEHLPYRNAIALTASENKIFCATPYSFFSVNPTTKEIQRFSKISGLTETGISTIGFDPFNKKLVAAYTSGNIDVIAQNNIANVPGLKRANINRAKKINHIYPLAAYTYLATSIGIIVLDTKKNEIKDSWVIGNSGNYVTVNMIASDAQYFYAATDEGLKKLPFTAPNGADYKAWQNLSGKDGLSAVACKGVVTINNEVICLQNDSLFIQRGNSWRYLFSNGLPVTSINSSENKIALCQQGLSKAQVAFINGNGSIDKVFDQPIIQKPKSALLKNGTYWIADSLNGLLQWQGNSFEQYNINAPYSIATGQMVVHDNTLYAAAGSIDKNGQALNNAAGIYRLQNGQWTTYNRFTFAVLDSLKDVVTLAIDRRNNSLWAGSFGDGLLNIKTGPSFQKYKNNSPIQPSLTNRNSYQATGLQFDAAHNLWIANYGAAQYLHVLKENNTWQSFTPPIALNENAVAQIVIDDANQKWIAAPKGNGVLCFNHGTTIENTADDKWKLLKGGTGRGNLPSNEVLCLAKDKNGFIWIGTADGIGVVQCPEQIFTTGCEATLPITKDGSFAAYLFKGENVNSIAVDGADRKWIGTDKGAWLIDAAGEKVLQHFTEERSPLLSNVVHNIAINGSTGEVFFATANGICSYKGSATEGAATNDSLLVYPNPVTPEYNGTIAIKGLAEGSFVKITEAAGRLVYQTKALGGQALWNGKDYTGRRVQTGVYLVIVTDENKIERGVGKIVFINN